MMMILANHAKHSKKKLSMLMCVCQHMFETRMKLCHTSEAHQCQLVDFTEPLKRWVIVVIVTWHIILTSTNKQFVMTSLLSHHEGMSVVVGLYL